MGYSGVVCAKRHSNHGFCNRHFAVDPLLARFVLQIYKIIVKS